MLHTGLFNNCLIRLKCDLKQAVCLFENLLILKIPTKLGIYPRYLPKFDISVILANTLINNGIWVNSLHQAISRSPVCNVSQSLWFLPSTTIYITWYLHKKYIFHCCALFSFLLFFFCSLGINWNLKVFHWNRTNKSRWRTKMVRWCQPHKSSRLFYLLTQSTVWQSKYLFVYLL